MRRRRSPVDEPRRTFLQRSLLGGAAFWVAPQVIAQRAAAALPALQALSASEARTLAAVGDTLVPGAVAAGLVGYVDAQLGAPAGRSMLMSKYVGVAAPLEFYRAGIAAIAAAARREHGRDFDALDADQRRSLVGRCAAGTVADWQGPPAPLLYFVLRSDAVDVSYGTPQGFAKLGIPYRAHIEPPDGWSA